MTKIPSYGLIKNLPGKRKIIRIEGDTVHFVDDDFHTASRAAHRSRVTFLADKPKWTQDQLPFQKNAFGISKGVPRSMPKQYRRAEARNAGQRLRLRAHGITHPSTKPPLLKPPIWKRPGYQLAAGAIVAGALGGTMYSYHKGRKQALENPAPAMPTGQYGPVGKSAKSDRNWHAGFAAGNAGVGGLAAASAFKVKGGTNKALMGGWAGLSGLIAAREAQQARKAHLRLKRK